MRNIFMTVAAVAGLALTACGPSASGPSETGPAPATDNGSSGDGAPASETDAAPPTAVSEPATVPVGESSNMLSNAGLVIQTEGPGDGAVTYSDACLITETSMSGVPVPSTLGQFAAAFPAGSTLVFEPYYMVDLGSLCLVEDGAEKVCTWFYVYDTEVWDPAVEASGLFTSSTDCRTAEGVGPGTPVSDAVQAYGDPQFQFNYDNEGREYVSFDRAPQAFGFRAASDDAAALIESGAGNPQDGPMWPNGEFGGDYRASDTQFETSNPMPDAVIASVNIL